MKRLLNNIVRRPSISSSEEFIADCLKFIGGARLAKYKELTGGVRFVEMIPKNPSGKILKRILRDEAQAEMKRENAKL